MRIDYEELLKEKLRTGVTLFTGAGFSTLPNASGDQLPTGSELCKEISNLFEIPKDYDDDLESISELAQINNESMFQSFLRKRFHVETYNPLYDVLNKIHLKAYITTNIDNLIQCVMDNSSSYYLHSAVQYGASKNNVNEVQYIPLHGDVNDIESHLYFGKFDLAVVDQYNHNLFEIMYTMTKIYPVLFWGYGFHDDGVKKVVSRIIKEKRQDIWILCKEEGSMSSFYKRLGCNVIIGSTEELLKWIDKNISIEMSDASEGIPEALKTFSIPTVNSVAVIPREEYYLNSRTNWYNVISNHTYNREEVPLIEDTALKYKNVIMEGLPFSGKTSMLMQLALKVNRSNKLFCTGLTTELAQFIIQNTKHLKECTIFVDECADDMEAYALLAETDNIKTIATADSFGYESSKHILSNVVYKKIEIGDLSITDAHGIYSMIPDRIRNVEFVYKESEDERFGMFEMMSKNVRGILSKQKVKRILNKAYKKNYKVFEIIAVTSYLTSNKSLASVDIFLSYFEEDYENVLDYIKQAQDLLADVELNQELVQDAIDENYYVLRSHLFAFNANLVLVESYKEEYANIIRRFIKNTNSFKIYNHYVFRRSAYDAGFFYGLYGDEANDIYKSIYEYDRNAYTLQQWALYLMHAKNYSGAFSKIDDAINLKPYNFSIQNTHAIILFEANKLIKTSEAEDELKHAMNILEDCYKSDKRKVYHAQKFAEFALFLYKEWRNPEYISTAHAWINNIIDTEESRSTRTMQLKRLLDDYSGVVEPRNPIK